MYGTNTIMLGRENTESQKYRWKVGTQSFQILGPYKKRKNEHTLHLVFVYQNHWIRKKIKCKKIVEQKWPRIDREYVLYLPGNHCILFGFGPELSF